MLHLPWAMCLMRKATFAASLFYQRHRAKVGRHARCISISAFVRHCWNTVLAYASLTHSAHCLSAKKAGTSQPTPCVSCSWTSTRQWGSRMPQAHSGRRTYITRLANKGVGVRLLAELAGHSHISTTQRYIDVNSEQLSEAVELL